MSPSPEFLDAFDAVADPRRRRMVELLAEGEETPVNDLVGRLGWPQPVVSKHLGVLKLAGLVNVRRQGRQRYYRLNGERLKSIHDWARMFERFWTRHLDRIKERAERRARERAAGPRHPEHPRPKGNGS